MPIVPAATLIAWPLSLEAQTETRRACAAYSSAGEGSMSVADHSDIPSHTGTLDLRLFGQFRVLVDGQPIIRLRSRKGEWLLALLALRRGCNVQRDFLMASLWPDSSEEAAAGSLRQSLHDLRRALGGQATRVASPTARSLRFEASDAEVDVCAFDSALARGQLADLEIAVLLYTGALLEGCTEEWVVRERERRELEWLRAVEAVASHEVEAGNAERAIELLGRAVAVDPFRESSQRGLMISLARCGDYGAAVERYRALRLMLWRELRCEPDPATIAIYEQLRTEARGRAARSAAEKYVHVFVCVTGGFAGACV